MHNYARARLLIAAALVIAACTDSDAPLGPTGVSTTSFMADAASPTAIAEPIDRSSCPTVTPFTVRFGVTVRAIGSSAVTITGIRARFTDSFGRSSAQVTFPSFPVTLPAIGPTLQFGESQIVRTFPLVLGIGCGTDEQGTVIVLVDGVDGRGRRTTQQVRVDVR